MSRSLSQPERFIVFALNIATFYLLYVWAKTELVLDLVREALKQKTKVFCVDLTGEYRARLSDANPETIGFTAEEGSDLEEKLFAVETGTYGAPNEKKALKAFIDALKSEAKKGISSFLGKPGAGLGLFELAEVTNTKASLRATELYLSEIMQWAPSQGTQNPHCLGRSSYDHSGNSRGGI